MADLPESLSERLERLVQSEPDLAAELSLERVLQTVADLAAEVIGARYAAVGMLHADGRTLESFTTHGLTEAERSKMGSPPRGHGILGLVIHQGRSMRLDDLMQHPAAHGFPAHHPPMHSFLGVPIVGKRGVMGDLYLTERLGGGSFSAEDEHLATLLARRAAAAIENARLHEESARLLEEVQLLHRSRERFFAMVNHELRNALAAVYGWAEMLVRRKDPATVPKAAFEVLDSAEQAISLINDLLDLSRLDEDRLRPAFRNVNCRGSVRQAIARLTPIANDKDVRIQSTIPEAEPICRTDPHRLEQILVNLLTNAVRHSPNGGRVSVTVAADEARVSFTVEDQGPGIAAGQEEEIFDIYVTKAGDETKGAGLGLPLSRRLAKLLGGELHAVSRSGLGGYFVLQLPAGAEEGGDALS